MHAKKQINQGSAISQTFTSYDSLWTSGTAVAYILPSLWILYEDNSSTVKISFGFGLATNPNPTRARRCQSNINPKPDPKPDSISGPAGSGRVADL